MNRVQLSNLFFIGLNPRWQRYKFLPDGLNIMYSAGSFWNGRDDWRRPVKKFPKKSGLKFLDSGGYLALLRWGKYPFSVVNYANLVCKLRPCYYASMDYACEPSLVGVVDSVDRRICCTVENAAMLAEYEDQLAGLFVPVIQGYQLDEYFRCLELYQQAGLIREYMAVGSMCRRLSVVELRNLVSEIYLACRNAGVKRLFDLKISPSLVDLDRYIWSRDSAVILDDYSGRNDGRRWPRGQAEKKERFNQFLGRLNKLGLQYVQQAI
jgi:hypothetical protein